MATQRRAFLKSTGVLATTPWLGAGLAACGGGDGDNDKLGTDAQLKLDATQAVAAIRDGRVSAEAYVSTLIARAKTLSDLNALIVLNEAGALTAARAVDAARATGTALGALAGLPIVVKDNINTKDLPTTGGTAALRNVRPTVNAPSLQKLIDADLARYGKIIREKGLKAE